MIRFNEEPTLKNLKTELLNTQIALAGALDAIKYLMNEQPDTCKEKHDGAIKRLMRGHSE